MTPSDKPTIKARDIIGSQVIAGDNNKAHMFGVKVTLPPADTVNIATELASLRELLETLSGPDQGKLDRALLDAEDEARKDSPDTQELADAVTRAVKYAKEADGIIDLAQKWGPRLAAIASWAGTAGAGILAAAGLTF